MMKNNAISIIWKSTIERFPWKDFFLGFFVPLNLLYVLMYFRQPLPAVTISFLWCLLYSLVEYFRSKRIIILAIMTAGMILINFATSFLAHHKFLYLIVEMLDNSIVGFIFLFSLFTARPFVLNFVDDATMKAIPDKIKNDQMFMNAWKVISAAWGIAYVASATVLTISKASHSHFTFVLDYLAGWPLAFILFVFSFSYPTFYWKACLDKIENKSASPQAPPPQAPPEEATSLKSPGEAREPPLP
jgi:hypothetical protein